MSNSNITLEKISSMFHMPEKAVAAELGMCLTSLKKIARKYGVTRWPYRKLKSIKRTMQKMNEDQSCLEVISTCVPRPSFPRLDEVVAGIDGAATRHATLAHKDSGNSSSSSSSRGGAEGNHGCNQSSELGYTVMTAHINSAAERDCHLGHDDQGSSSSHASSGSGRDEEYSDDGSILQCKVSGGVLSIDNWSELWTVASLRKHLLLPLGGSSLSFSTDGCIAHLTFTTPLASLQAKRVVELASKVIIEDTTPFSSPSPSSSDADESEHDAEEEEVEEATPPPLSNSVFAPHSEGYYNLWAGPTSSTAQAQSSCTRGFIVSPPCSFSLEDRQISGSVLSSGWSSFMAQGAC